MAVAVPYIAYAAASYIIGRVAGGLLGGRDKRPKIDGSNIALASRGSYIPLLIGRRQLAPVILWNGDRTVTSEGNAGGKGVTGGGGSQLVYRSSSMHGLCLGPARKLHRIRENDKIIWEASDLGGSYDGGITAETHPSGSSITVSGHGSFRIFWGERDQPSNTFLGDVDADGTPRLGYVGRHPFLCYILWIQKRTGGTPVWGRMEYELECRPYKVGDTYDYTGPYEGRFGLPERLSQSLGWIDNGLGPFGTPHDIALAIDDPAQGIIKLAGNVVPFGTPPSFGDIEDNSAIADGRYAIDTITYNASETLRDLSGIYVAQQNTLVFSSWTIPFGSAITSIVADPTQEPPPDPVPVHSPPFPVSDVQRISMNTADTNTKELTFVPSGGGAVFMSPGMNRMRFWVRGFGVGNFTELEVGLHTFDHPSLADTDHYVTFTYSPSGTPTAVEFNGGYGTMVFVGATSPGGGASLAWWMVDFYYRSGTGTNPSDENWKRRLEIRFENDNASSVLFYGNPFQSVSFISNAEYCILSEDVGTLVTGVTTVLLDEPLEGSHISRGTFQFLTAGSGPDGANIAHTIDQLFFEPYPHGQGFPRSVFDLDSLEEVGVTLGVDGEGLRTHVLIEDGDTLETAIDKIRLDVGLLIPWDPVQGKYVFKLVRDSGTPHQIPTEMVHGPLPQITTVLEAVMYDRKIYMFKDRDANYRDAPAPAIDDDGKSSREDRQNARKEDIYIVTDYEAAAQVASRREQYEINPPSAYEFFLGRAARRLIPGDRMEVEGYPESLRIMEVGPIEQTSAKIKVKTLTDIYSAPPPNVEL